MAYDGYNYGGEGSRTTSYQEYQKQLEQHRKNNYGKSGQDFVRGLFGGPVGWYELASGKSLLGQNDPFAGSTLSDSMDEEVYNSMSPDEWARFAKMSREEQAAFFDSRKREIAAVMPELQKKAKAEKELADKRSARETAQDDLIKKVQAFADEMNMPIDQLMQKDEFAQALNKQSYQNAMGRALNTGAGMGGLSQVNADQATKNALLGYQMQRKSMGQQAMGQAFGMLQNQNVWAEDIARYNQGLDFQMQEAEAMRRMQEYQQGMGQAQGMAGMIGGIAGAIYGGPSGAAMGQQIGSNLGGMRYQSNNPYQSYKFTYPSTSRKPSGSGGLGGNY